MCSDCQSGPGGEAGLVVDAVEGVVVQQVQLEALARGAGFDEASLCATLAAVARS
jgi:hypothetical protein